MAASPTMLIQCVGQLQHRSPDCPHAVNHDIVSGRWQAAVPTFFGKSGIPLMAASTDLTLGSESAEMVPVSALVSAVMTTVSRTGDAPV